MIFTVAAGLGAVARYVIRSQTTSGTLIVNVVGAVLLGWLAAGPWDRNELWVLGTGFLGSFTTFSTWMWESKEEPSGVGIAVAAGLLGAFLGSLAA